MTDGRRFVLVTGLSGAGKSQALNVLEDLGYYCVDNLPTALVPPFAEAIAGATPRYRRLAVCVDARAGQDVENLPAMLDRVSERGPKVETLFLDCSDEVLRRRYSETRRPHPADTGGGIVEGMRRERAMLAPIRARADFVLDTSAVKLPELRERIAALFVGDRSGHTLSIVVTSFGFKYGLPPEADLVFDVRFLPNPHYDPALRPFTGNDDAIRDYVLNNDTAREFMQRLHALLEFVVPKYVSEGKAYLTIAVGCTGGRHRSVAVANALREILHALDYESRLRHRDLESAGDGR